MRYARTAKLDSSLQECVEQSQAEGPVVITRQGKNVAVVIAPADEDELERLVLAYSPKFQALLEKSRQSIREGRGLSHDEFWQAVEQRHKGLKKERAPVQRKTPKPNGKRTRV